MHAPPPAHARLSPTPRHLEVGVCSSLAIYRIERLGSASARAAASAPPHRGDRLHHGRLKNVASELDIELDGQGWHLGHDAGHVVDAIDNLEQIVAKLEQLRAVLVDSARGPVRAHLRPDGQKMA